MITRQMVLYGNDRMHASMVHNESNAIPMREYLIRYESILRAFKGIRHTSSRVQGDIGLQLV